MWKRISYAIFIFYYFVLFFSLLHFSSFIFLMMIVAMITSLWNVISRSACYASSAWLCVKTYPALWELYVTLLQTLKCQSMPDSNSDKKKRYCLICRGCLSWSTAHKMKLFFLSFKFVICKASSAHSTAWLSAVSGQDTFNTVLRKTKSGYFAVHSARFWVSVWGTFN